MAGRGPALTQMRLSPSFWLGLVCVLIVACCVADVFRPMGLVAPAATAVTALIIGRVPLRGVLLRLAPLVSFCVIALVLVLLVPVVEGSAALMLPGWSRPISRQGVEFIVDIAAKAALIVLLVTGSAARMGERDLLEGLLGLRLPSKLVSLLYLVVRQLHSVREETGRLIRGRDARGRPGGLAAVRVAGAMAQVLLVRLARRAETQAMALASRGFEGRITLGDWRALTPSELLMLILIGAFTLWMTAI